VWNNSYGAYLLQLWEEKVFARPWLSGRLPRAGKEARNSEIIRQHLKSVTFANGKESLGKRGGVDVAADFFDVNAYLALPPRQRQSTPCLTSEIR
jgi:hypothetical protein